MDGQTSIADMQEIMPDKQKETAADTQENTIDGEYRELMPQQDEITKTEKVTICTNRNKECSELF